MSLLHSDLQSSRIPFQLADYSFVLVELSAIEKHSVSVPVPTKRSGVFLRSSRTARHLQQDSLESGKRGQQMRGLYTCFQKMVIVLYDDIAT